MFISLRTRHLSLLLILALTAPVAARADEASHRAKAQEMMTLLQTQRMIKQIADNITKQITDAANGVAGANPSPDTKTKVADFEKQSSKLIDAQISWDSMRDSFTEVYVKNFTEEELDSIISFYKTPAGKALVDKMPTVNTQISQFGATRMATLQPQMKELFEAFRKSQATEPPAVSPAAPPTLGAPTAPATSAPKPSTPK